MVEQGNLKLPSAGRAQYGETLLGALSELLTQAGIEGMAARPSRLYR